jgi:type II secretory pathway pseudopilin PulG
MHQRSAARAGPSHGGAGRQLSRRTTEAFTLTELMIVVSIVTLLMGAIFPTYQRARDAALIGSMVDELLGHAKACALINGTGVGTTPSPAAVSAERGGVEITAGCTGEQQGATLVATWGTARSGGVPCLGSRSLISSSKATVTITPQSALSCAFED